MLCSVPARVHRILNTTLHSQSQTDSDWAVEESDEDDDDDELGLGGGDDLECYGSDHETGDADDDDVVVDVDCLLDL